MEVSAFQECWKAESLTFVKEEFYESIHAPMWVDFTLTLLQQPQIDDNAWFCVRAGCDQKHGTLLDQTPDRSFSLKSRASKSTSCISKSPTMEGKPSVRPRRRAQLSTPTSKGKDRTPGKAKPPVMSASKLRHKQCKENEDPNSTNIGALNFKMRAIGAEGFSSPKPSSNADGMDSLEENPPDILTGKQIVAASDINLTPQNQSIKVTTAFSTPRIKNNHSVKREPFRSNPALSKGMNTTARSKAVAPRRILFETPTKSVKKTPSKDLTPVKKKFANPKKHVQFSANDNKYSSPAKVTPRACFTPCSLQPSESPLSRAHNFPSSSRPKDSRKVTNHPPSSHRNVLFSEQSNEKESLIRANVHEMDLVQGKVGSPHKDGGWSENQSSIKQPYTGNGDEQNPLTYPGENSREENSKEIMKHECRMKEQYAAQLVTIISGKRLTYGINEIQSHKESESYGAEESTSDQDEVNGVQQIFKCLRKDRETKKQSHSDGKAEITILEVGENDEQNKFDVEADDCNLERRDNEAEMNSATENRVAREMTLIKNWFPSELVSNLQNDSDGRAEITILEDGKHDAQDALDARHNDDNLKERETEVLMNSGPENERAREEISINFQFASGAKSNLQIDFDGITDILILEDGRNDVQSSLDVECKTHNFLERANTVIKESAAESGGAREDSIKKQLASESEGKDKHMEGKAIRALKKETISTPSKGEKRTSGEMNAKINCSNGEVCQDESCCMAFSTCQSALPAKAHGTSIPRVFNHKKIKPTLPRPFRLRTAERGERKQMDLSKKTQLAEKNETSPLREKRANKAQGNHSHIDPSKRGKPETPKSGEGKPKSRPRHTETVKAKTICFNLQLEDKGEEIKSTPEEPLHHRPVVKMPNFWKPPFKPMRSTKKLTTPKEPNFHPMHSKKHCTKGRSGIIGQSCVV